MFELSEPQLCHVLKGGRARKASLCKMPSPRQPRRDELWWSIAKAEREIGSGLKTPAGKRDGSEPSVL